MGRAARARRERGGAGAAGAVAASLSLISLESPRDTALSSAPSSCSCERRSNSLWRWCCSASTALRYARSVSSSAWRQESGSLPACRQEAVGAYCRSPARAGRAAGCRSRRTSDAETVPSTLTGSTASLRRAAAAATLGGVHPYETLNDETRRFITMYVEASTCAEYSSEFSQSPTSTCPPN